MHLAITPIARTRELRGVCSRTKKALLPSPEAQIAFITDDYDSLRPEDIDWWISARHRLAP